ncbi:uncharacterized protein [Aquarana catesbeiana]|uniref:uncharacterized protein n=1 Tax=Aquarana catesbeiana TaxID=8400 RepID=UPI003CCA12BD
MSRSLPQAGSEYRGKASLHNKSHILPSSTLYCPFCVPAHFRLLHSTSLSGSFFIRAHYPPSCPAIQRMLVSQSQAGTHGGGRKCFISNFRSEQTAEDAAGEEGGVCVCGGLIAGRAVMSRSCIEGYKDVMMENPLQSSDLLCGKPNSNDPPSPDCKKEDENVILSPTCDRIPTPDRTETLCEDVPVRTLPSDHPLDLHTAEDDEEKSTPVKEEEDPLFPDRSSDPAEATTTTYIKEEPAWCQGEHFPHNDLDTTTDSQCVANNGKTEPLAPKEEDDVTQMDVPPPISLTSIKDIKEEPFWAEGKELLSLPEASMPMDPLQGSPSDLKEESDLSEEGTLSENDEESKYTPDTEEQLYSGEQYLNSGDGAYICSECGLSFSNVSEFDDHHQVTHPEEQPHFCSECGKSFTSKANLLKHQTIHSGEELFTCGECGRRFPDSDQLAKHEQTHTGSKPYACTECGKCFSYQRGLMRHRKIHTGVKPYSCTECGKSFITRAELVIHQRSHTGEKPYPCSECGRCFSQFANLSQHLKRHTGQRPFVCHKCGKAFTQNAHLLSHQKTHGPEKPYPCHECGKGFTTKTYLVEHQRSHRGENPYCEICRKYFVSTYYLAVHRRIHTGEKPFMCSICLKGCYTKANLEAHQRIHTRERRFTCRTCGIYYESKFKLVHHQKSHKVPPPPPSPPLAASLISSSSLPTASLSPSSPGPLSSLANCDYVKRTIV